MCVASADAAVAVPVAEAAFAVPPPVTSGEEEEAASSAARRRMCRREEDTRPAVGEATK